MGDSSDVVVIGGGVIGLAIGRDLAGAGLAVTLVERGELGAGSTSAAAALLSPTDPPEWAGDLGRFNLDAIDGWPAWADGLAAETGRPSGLEARGELRLGLREEPFIAAALAGVERAGWECDVLDREAVRRLVPDLALPEGVSVWFMPRTTSVNTGLLTEALVAACRARGVRLLDRVRVTGLAEGGRRVRLSDGRELTCGRLVVAAGAWSSEDWLPAEIRPDVRPVLGESLIVRPPSPDVCPLPLRGSDGSIVPRADGTLWLGTTVLERGYQERPGLGSVAGIAVRAIALLPPLEDAAFLRAQSGLRPVSADGMPVVGPASEHVVLATAHGREGIIHAPRCAAVVAAGMAAGDWSGVPASFLPDGRLLG